MGPRECARFSLAVPPVAPREGAGFGAFGAKTRSFTCSAADVAISFFFYVSASRFLPSRFKYFLGASFRRKKPRRMDSPLSFKFGPGRFEPTALRYKARAPTTQPLGRLIFYSVCFFTTTATSAAIQPHALGVCQNAKYLGLRTYALASGETPKGYDKT